MFAGTAPPFSSVSRKGAAAGAVLCGLKPRNAGLRVRILQDQARGPARALRGPFVLLAAGRNPYADVLRPLVGQEIDAAAVLRAIRQKYRSAVNVVNADLLGGTWAIEAAAET